MSEPVRQRRLLAGFGAGLIALAANEAALAAAANAGVETAKGGLLRLAVLWIGPLIASTPIPHFWQAMNGAGPSDGRFQLGFHIFIGLVMAEIYALWLESRLSRGPWRKGLIYAAVVWALNALVVLPLTGEGVAGAKHLTGLGIVLFALAHTLFFVGLALSFAVFTRETSP